MNYEQKYKEAIVKLRELFNSAEDNNETLDLWFNDFVNIFPELKESNDEKIRKWLIKVFQHSLIQGKASLFETNDIKIDNVLAWLEKQGEQNKWKPSKDEMDALYGLAYITNKMDDKKDEAVTKLYQDLKREFFNGTSYENMFPSSPVDAPMKDEKQGEHDSVEEPNFFDDFRNTDSEVKPKFHEGEWIIGDKDNTIHQVKAAIENVSNGKYAYDLIDGGYISTSHESDYHLWTIQDAKDGDVLAVEPIEGYSSSFVAIYKERGLDFFNSYCFVGFDGKFYKGENGHSIEKIHPATKEQHDLLFKKMHKAGYEWDAENKKLKKIEQKSADKVEPKFKAGDKVLVDGKICTIKLVNEDNYIVDENGRDVQEHFSYTKDWELVEQKPAWSEEDEKYINDITNYFVEYDDLKHKVSDVVNWLKSLKDRVQQKQEWSEEDVTMLDSAIAFVEHSTFTTIGKGKNNVIAWLKSLRPQNKWKPSDEQMYNLSEAAHYNCAFFDMEILKGLYDDLKKLREE